MNIATISEYTAATTADSVGVKMPNFRPKMMMNGSIKAQKLSTTARPTSRPDFFGGGTMFSLRTSHHQATARPMPMRTPGTSPARNSLVIETPPMTPNTTKPMLGGMMGPITPAAAISPPARALSCPAWTIMGTSNAESAAASATAEPDRADRTQA